MLARGQWVVPYLQGEPYLDKPPLFYWLVIGSYRLFGVHDWSAHGARLAVHGCILLTYLLGRRRLGEGPAFWGASFLPWRLASPASEDFSCSTACSPFG